MKQLTGYFNKTMQFVVVFIMNYSLSAQDFNEALRQMASDGQLADHFGYSVSISGNYAIIGSYGDAEDEFGGNTMPDAGSAYIFERDSYGTWHQVQKLVASDRVIPQWFGYSVHIFGNFAIVGAPTDSRELPGESEMRWSGAAYIFERDVNGIWHEIQKLTASDKDSWDCFGVSVCISANRAIVGAPNEDHDASGLNTIEYAGSAYIYKRTATGTWEQVQKIVPSSRGEYDMFGFSVSLSGNLAVIGAYHENDGAGAAYVFEPDELGFWYEVQRLSAFHQDHGDFFGTSVCLNEEFIVIGAPHDEDDAYDETYIEYAGSAYIFERDATGIWQNVQKLVASDWAMNDEFGCQVGISGNYAIIGSFQEDEDAYGNNTLQNAGSAYIFYRNDTGTWNQVQKIVVSNRSENEFFGTSVSISGDYAAVGTNPGNGEGIGFVSIFESCNPSAFSDPLNILENGDFGSCKISPWSLYYHDYLGVSANEMLMDGKWEIEIDALAEEPQAWHVQPTQILTESQINLLEPGATYNISFNSSAGSDNRQCRVVLGQNESPYNTVFAQDIFLGTEDKSYSLDFILNEKYTSMKFSFDIGTESSSVTFDNIRLVKKEDINPDAINQTKSSDFKIYPNPANELLYIEADPDAIIIISDVFGKVVKTTRMTDTVIELTISDLIPGIYMVRAAASDSMLVQKILIQ